jgi:hypothetical protein
MAKREVEHPELIAKKEAEPLDPLKVREVRISEQLAYQLLAFLSRYQADVKSLRRLARASDPELLEGYLEAMAYGDCQDAKRLAEALERAINALYGGGDA